MNLNERPRVFISRELGAESEFRQYLSRHGVEVLGKSLLRFEAMSFSEVPPSDWVFPYSQNAMTFFFHLLNEKNDVIKNNNIISRKWAVLGEPTAEILWQKFQIRAAFVGNGQPTATAEAFADFLTSHTYERVLFLRTEQSERSIEKILLEKNIKTDSLVTYKSILLNNFNINFCNILIFTSPMNARAYFEKHTQLVEGQQAIAIGKTTASTLAALGVPTITAKSPYEAALADEVLSLLF